MTITKHNHQVCWGAAEINGCARCDEIKAGLVYRLEYRLPGVRAKQSVAVRSVNHAREILQALADGDGFCGVPTVYRGREVVAFF